MPGSVCDTAQMGPEIHWTENMFDTYEYLNRIGYYGSHVLSAETLSELHKAQLETIPYDGTETASAHTSAGFEDAYERIVRGWRGGRCTDLNRLFAALLRQFGFDVRELTADVAPSIALHEPRHTLNCVTLGAESWLLDVGFPGPSFLEPLRLMPGIVQEQYGCLYRIVGGLILQRKSLSRDWHTVYRIRTRTRSSPERHAGIHPVYARAVGRGQLIVSGDRYMRVEDGYENVRRLDPGDGENAINEILHSWEFPALASS